MPREITITPVLNGFICQVGCQKVVFLDVRSLAIAVEEYYNHPEDTEKRFIEKAVNRMNEGPLPCPPPPPSQDCCGTEAPQQNRILEGRPRR